ncbi:sensor histidine kinase [Anaerotalea alkaliphila]|uniref:Sensor histidine kinase n=1 Tax=Anaerotalea alkaliphila TaxID=2662126 RepID=A0A7X5KNT4_9FIRM|nr:histidine kinase [Anaerotalea alkaliphila]NDL67067.1 sensor histidine kinase [Anaerotalea alkaliphila]
MIPSKRIAKWVANLPLKRKIMAIIMIIHVSMLSTMLIFGIKLVIQSNNKLIYESTASALSGSSYYIENTLDNATVLANIMLADPTIQSNLSILAISGDSIVQRSAYQSLYSNLLNHYAEFKKNHITNISLATGYSTVDTNRLLSLASPEEVRMDILGRALAADGAIAWVTGNGQDHGMFLTRSIRRIQNLDLSTIGILTITIDPDQMIRSATRFSQQYDSATYALFNEEGALIYSSDALASPEAASIPKTLSGSYDVVTLDGHKYFAVQSLLEKYGWTYISLVPYDSIYDSIRVSYMVYAGVVCAGILLAMALSSLLTRLLVRHFDNLVLKMRKFSSDTEAVPVGGYDYSERTDELGLLHRQFDDMATRIRYLLNENYLKELLIKEAQIKALETQLNPHFLYNILESVNWRAKAIGAEKISQMVESLGRMLRSTLSREEGLITLKQELDFIGDYITIQQLRFEEHLVFHQDIPSAYHDALLPRLTIQPLVENAIHYGLEENLDGCSIELSLLHADDDLFLFVKNSGSTIDPDLLELLEGKSVQPGGLGIGLLNIHKRIRLTFGAPYGLKLYNEEGHAVVCIHIPYRNH